MAFLLPEQVAALGFASVGHNVLISERASIYGPHRISLGDNIRIDDFAVISGKVTMRRNIHISVFCSVAGGEEGVLFEDFSGLAPACQVFSETDDYSGAALTNPTVPGQYRQETKKAVLIGRHCIVGANSLIFPGVTLGTGCAVGAMSMVTKSTEPWGIYAGVPARRIGHRRQNLLQLEAAYLSEQAPKST
jgi:acetyltransferase-like isoleucine patch superfamily enzyme